MAKGKNIADIIVGSAKTVGSAINKAGKTLTDAVSQADSQFRLDLQNGNLEKVKDYLKTHALTNDVDTLGIVLKSTNANSEIIKLLLGKGAVIENSIKEFSKIAAINGDRIKAFDVLITEGDKSLVATALNADNGAALRDLIKNNGFATVYHEAPDLFKHLREAGANLNGVFRDEATNKDLLPTSTPLTEAIDKLSVATVDDQKKAYIGIAKQLIINGAIANTEITREGGKFNALELASNLLERTTNSRGEELKSAQIEKNIQTLKDLKDAFRDAQEELGVQIRENRMKRMGAQINKIKNKLFNSGIVVEEIASNRDELRSQQKAIGKALRSSHTGIRSL